MIHFFIDTNVLLSFYAFTQDNLTRLEGLADEVDAGRFEIVTTEHVRNEFSRNRDNRIVETLKRFQDQRLASIPRLCEPYEEMEQLRDLSREYSKLHGQLLGRITDDARAHALKADQLVERFFDGATTLTIDADAVAKARLRGELGNPPGKGGSMGDAVNWELLLAYQPTDHLFFVTGDSDFYSPLDEDRPLEYLTAEWSRVVGAPIDFVRRLSQLPDEVPHEVLPVEDDPEDERDELVERLLHSGSFATTHHLMARLLQHRDFTAAQVAGLVDALANNSQVGFIYDDVDVYEFYSRLLASHEALLSSNDREFLHQRLFTPDQLGDRPSELM